MDVEIDYLMREIIKKKFSKLEEIPRDPRRDRDFCRMIFRDRDETETRNVKFLEFSIPRRDFFNTFYQPPFC